MSSVDGWRTAAKEQTTASRAIVGSTADADGHSDGDMRGEADDDHDGGESPYHQ